MRVHNSGIANCLFSGNTAAKTLLELIDTATSTGLLLLTSIERVTAGTDVQMNIFGHS